MPWNPQGTPQEVQSPTALVLQYLQSKGLQPTSQNVNAALQMNATNPGVISGLINQAPPQADPPQAAPGPAAPPTAALPIPTPPVPPGPPVASPSGQPAPDAPAPAPGGGGGVDPDMLMAILGGGGLSALGYGAYKLGGSNTAAPKAPGPGTMEAPVAAGPRAPVSEEKPFGAGDVRSTSPLEDALLKALDGEAASPKASRVPSSAPSPTPSSTSPAPTSTSDMIRKALGYDEGMQGEVIPPTHGKGKNAAVDKSGPTIDGDVIRPQIGQTLQIGQEEKAGGSAADKIESQGSQKQVAGFDRPQLSASAPKPAIRLKDATSGPTIPLGTTVLPRATGAPSTWRGEGTDALQRPVLRGMGEPIDFGSILRAIAPTLKRAAR